MKLKFNIGLILEDAIYKISRNNWLRIQMIYIVDLDSYIDFINFEGPIKKIN